MPRAPALTLVIDGTVDPLKRSQQAAKAILADLGQDAALTAEKIRDEMAKAVANPGDAVALMAKNLDREFRTLRQQAEQAMKLGADFNPVGGMSSRQSLEAAAGLEKVAAAHRERAAAALQAEAADERAALALRTIATQSAAASAAAEEQARALRVQGDAFAAIEARLPAVARSQMQVTQTTGQMRAGMQQLGFQLNDVAVQFASGTPPMMIFAMQGTQVIQSLQMMETGGNRFLKFLGGPWGIALGIAATVLGALIAKSDLFGDSLDQSAEMLDKVKLATDGVRSSQSILGQVMDLTTGKITEQSQAMRDLAQAQLLVAKAKAETGAAQAARDLKDLQGKEWVVGGGMGGGFSISRETNPAARTIANVQSGAMSVSAGMGELKFLLDAGRVKEESYLKAIAALANFNAETANAKAADAALRLLDGKGTKADRDLLLKPDKSPSSVRDTRSDQQVWESFKAELSKRGVFQASGRTGYRSAADQHDIFEAGESPLDGYKRKSRHQSWQALDPTRASFDEQAAREAAEAAGLKGFKIVSESGGRKHFEWSGHGKPGQVDVSGSEIAARRESAAIAKAAEEAERQGLKTVQDYAEAEARAMKAWQEKQVEGLQIQQDELDLKNELLSIEGQLAPTLRDKAAIAFEILENDRKIAKLKNDELVAAGQISAAERDRRNAAVDQVFDGRGRVAAREFQGPMGDYRDQLVKNVGDMDEALDRVKAGGLQSLEDGLVGLISGTESVSSAFKKMAASILADLARIAIQKAILSFFFAGGNVPAKATGHVPGFAGGVISGPGTGTSDSILAWHQGMGLIRVSNGESIITAAGTRKHRKLLQAINDGSLPSFASGMVDVGQMAYPALPRSNALRGGANAGPTQYFDLRGAVVTEELYRQMNAVAARYSAAALAAAPGLTRRDLNETAMERIPA